MDVVIAFEFPGERLEGRFRGTRTVDDDPPHRRPVGDAADADPHDLGALDARRHRDDGEIAAPARVASASGISELGSAWATEPHTVPLLRVWKWPTNGSVLASSGSFAESSGQSLNRFWVTAAPTSTLSPAILMVSSSARRAMSTRTVGSSRRRLSIAISDWPPASTLASSPCSARRASASATLSGRA